MYAVWMVGAAFAPLSPSYPAERMEFIRSNCDAKAVINEKFLRGIEQEIPLAQPVVPNPADPSLLIYTSGSTGKPKGVLHSHASITDSVLRYVGFAKTPEGSHAALGAPFTFVASVQGVFAPLCARITAYLMPFEAMRDPVLLADYIEEHQINRTFISPKMLKVFKQKGSCLRTVFTGSELVSDTYSDEFDIYVMYGQTESASAALAFKIDKPYENTPIGKPIGDIRTYILDENGNEADEGELCLAGIFADGYLGLPEQTAKTFTDNPFAAQDGYPKLLKTGDIVKRADDGNILYLNRKDGMVKINGQRVEPGEIDTIIKQTEGIHEAALKDFKNQYGQVYLVAYYVEDAPVDADDLREAIAQKLPPYMIPAFFIGFCAQKRAVCMTKHRICPPFTSEAAHTMHFWQATKRQKQHLKPVSARIAPIGQLSFFAVSRLPSYRCRKPQNAVNRVVFGIPEKQLYPTAAARYADVFAQRGI